MNRQRIRFTPAGIAAIQALSRRRKNIAVRPFVPWPTRISPVIHGPLLRSNLRFVCLPERFPPNFKSALPAHWIDVRCAASFQLGLKSDISNLRFHTSNVAFASPLRAFRIRMFKSQIGSEAISDISLVGRGFSRDIKRQVKDGL
jgi:hypothetical protein